MLLNEFGIPKCICVCECVWFCTWNVCESVQMNVCYVSSTTCATETESVQASLYTKSASVLCFCLVQAAPCWAPKSCSIIHRHKRTYNIYPLGRESTYIVFFWLELVFKCFKIIAVSDVWIFSIATICACLIIRSSQLRYAL